MMEATQACAGNHRRLRRRLVLNRAEIRCVLGEGVVNTVFLVVAVPGDFLNREGASSGFAQPRPECVSERMQVTVARGAFWRGPPLKEAPMSKQSLGG